MDRVLYAEVLVDIPAKKVDQGFNYIVPPHMEGRLRVGSMVLVPFGVRNVAGFVTGLGGPPVPLPEGVEIKQIRELLDEGPVYTPSQFELAVWMAGFYLCTTLAALKTIIGPRISGAGPKRVKGLYPVFPGGGAPSFGARAAKRKLAWETVADHPGISRKDLARVAGVSGGVVDRLISDGLIIYGDIELRRDPHPVPEDSARDDFRLTDEQAAALERIKGALDSEVRNVFLLHGITGSGKTEIYMRSIAHTLGRGRGAVVMVPEISLTPQMISAFKGRFGEKVAVLHSRLSEGERYDEWRRITCGLAPVVLGARSAAFAPLSNLGLIILDEEHETSYKQEETPRYHARDVALRLAAQFEAVVVLGSATPAIESYYRAQKGGRYNLLSLTRRIEMRPLPDVQVVDMRKELSDGNTGIFSRRLEEAVRDRLDRREQVILFLNRRGFATFVVCRECGLVMKCPHCDISLTYHAGGHLRCHYCNHAVPDRGVCPDCGGRQVGYFGTGTQRVEEEVSRLFPGAGVIRMDSDTTARKGSHGRMLRAFREREADILIGTQMVAKGLDMPAVTLVGVINADMTLHMPDFRSAERTFQLVAQVAGRAGRGELGGEVIVQTMSPDHYSIVHAAGHDYEGFYAQEMKIRKVLGYPPFSRIARVIITGVNEEKVKNTAGSIAAMALEKGAAEGVEVLGPTPAPLSKIKDRYRYHIILKSVSGNRLRDLLRALAGGISLKGDKDAATVVTDIDPLNLL
ncbi:MAG: primosomal protein N' [Bacillota bacterium]